MSKRRSHRRQQPVTVQSAQEGEFIPRQGGRAEAFTFGDPMPVLDGRGILDYLECWSNGRWYEPPLSMEGLAKAVGSSVYLQSGLKFKRNMLAKTFIPHRLLSRATFEQFSLDWLTFGSAYLEQPRSRLGTRMPLQAPLAKYIRRGTDLETFYQVRSWKDEHEFEKGSVIQLREAAMTNLLLYQRIAQQLAEDIRRGVYQPGERVPSVRKLSTQLNVSHATVLQAYATLEDQGLIRARPQSGFYVHRTPALTAPTPDIARVERPGLVTRSSIINQVLAESRREGVFPLGAAVPHVDYLPVRALHQQLAKVTRFQSPRAFSYMFSPGFEPLRRQVAIRMRDAGVVVDPSQVTITHGCVDAIHMALRVLTRPGDLIATESPSYYGLLQLADVLGLKVIEIPSDPRTGISLEALQLAANQWSIKALVLTARLSNPFGGTIPEDRQKQLLKLTAEHNIGVVEDDIYGELMFDQGQARSLKSHDRDGRVIYCSSFSKTISPGVRIGWIIAERYQEEIRRLQTFTTHSACTVTQMGVAAYLENGGYDRHLRYIRQEYRKNMTAYQLAVQQYFPEGTQMTRPKGGFILWVSLPAKVNTKELHVRALEQGISIAPGLIFSNTEQFNNCLRLTCGIPWNREAERAIMTLGMLAGQLCQEGLIAA